MISSRTIALAIFIQFAAIGWALAQAVEPAVPPPSATAESPPAVSAAGGGSSVPPIISTDLDVGRLAPSTVTLSAREVDELRAMCSQREDWRIISVCVRLRH